VAGPIRIAVLSNGAQARADLNKTSSAAEQIGNKFTKFRLPAALALGAVAAGAKVAVNAASDLNEETSKSEVIFGKQAAEIKKWASTAETALGQSERAALAAASTFGQIGQKAGLGGAATADFAQKFTGLASDLASFNNTTPEEAVLAIGAAMRGEAEPIRKYGVLLDDATLRSRALKEGLIDNIKQGLTPQQKALAASKEILAQTGKAQGDFARTSDGAANKSRILAAQQENMKAKLGQGLLPAYEAVLGVLSKFATFASNHTGLVKAIVIAVVALSVAVLAASAAQKIHTSYLILHNGAMVAFRAAQTAATIAQIAFNVALSANPIGLIVLGVIALVAAVILAYKKSDQFRAIVQKVGQVGKQAFQGIVSAAQSVYAWAKDKLPPAFEIFKTLVVGYLKLVTLPIRTVYTVLKNIATWAKTNVPEAFVAMKDKAVEIGSALLSPFQGLYDLVVKIINKIGDIKPPDLTPWDGLIPGARMTGRTLNGSIAAADPSALGVTQIVYSTAVETRNYTINVTVPLGGSLVEAGRVIVGAITAYEDAAGRRLTA
jgi:hypothetical protein